MSRSRRRKHEAVSGRLTASGIRTGLRARSGVILRAARPSEADRCAELADLAKGSGFENREALGAGQLGDLLLEAWAKAPEEPRLRFLGEQLLRASRAEQAKLEFWTRLTLVLVAEDPMTGVVGMSYCLPAIGSLLSWVDQGHARMAAVDVASLAVCKLMAVAVDPSCRGRGIGGELLGLTMRCYREAGWRLAYGQYSEHLELEQFYRANGFRVHAPGEPVDLDQVGLPGGLQPMPGDRMFSLWLDGRGAASGVRPPVRRASS